MTSPDFCTNQRAQADNDIGDDDNDDGDDDDDAGGCCFRTSQRRFRPVVEVGNKGRSIRALQINSAYRSPSMIVTMVMTKMKKMMMMTTKMMMMMMMMMMMILWR